jgi:hypothetical protein
MAVLERLTMADVDYLQSLLNAGMRGNAYLTYYDWTGSGEALLQAQISTYSNGLGSAALYANTAAKDANLDTYPPSIDSFSEQIAQAFVNAVRENVQNGGTGILSDQQVIQTAQATWANNGLAGSFPGNIYVYGLDNLTPGALAGIGGGVNTLLINGNIGYTPGNYPESAGYNWDTSRGDLLVITNSDGKVVYVGNDSLGSMQFWLSTFSSSGDPVYATAARAFLGANGVPGDTTGRPFNPEFTGTLDGTDYTYVSTQLPDFTSLPGTNPFNLGGPAEPVMSPDGYGANAGTLQLWGLGVGSPLIQGGDGAPATQPNPGQSGSLGPADLGLSFGNGQSGGLPPELNSTLSLFGNGSAPAGSGNYTQYAALDTGATNDGTLAAASSSQGASGASPFNPGGQLTDASYSFLNSAAGNPNPYNYNPGAGTESLFDTPAASNQAGTDGLQGAPSALPPAPVAASSIDTGNVPANFIPPANSTAQDAPQGDISVVANNYSGDTILVSSSSGGGSGLLTEIGDVLSSIGDFLASLFSPVELDLSGNGIKITPLSSSNMFFGMANDGYEQRTAWAGAGDGVLVYDPGGGPVTQADQVDFTLWDPSATSDMQALEQVFDTNHDGQLNASDADWSDSTCW